MKKNKALLLLLLLMPIATADLQAESQRVLWQNANPQGFLAGSTHFSDLWARDALYASWGAIQIGMSGPVRGTLKTLAKHQSSEGQIPLRVGSKSMVRKFLGVPAGYGPVYSNDKSGDPALDPNCLYVITLEKYFSKTGDEGLLQEQLVNAERAMEWLDSQKGDDRQLSDGPLPEYHLLQERPYASWDDALKKEGASIYNNACYYGALKAAYRLTQDEAYEQQAQQIRKAIDDVLWNGKHYDAWQGRRVLDVPGNLLAIELGVTDENQTRSVLEAIDTEKSERHHSVAKLNYPSYPKSDVYLPFRLIKMADYHNSGPWWSWVAALEAKVRADNGQEEKAEAIMDELAEWVKESGGVYETYQEPGEPLDRLFYNSEKDFSWTAGMVLYSGSSLSLSQ